MATADIPFFIKEPGERYAIAIEYANKLPSGATLASGTVSAVDLATNVTDNSVIVGTSATISGTQAKITVQAGVANKRYKITFLVTLNTGEILEDEVVMHVLDL